MDPTQFSSVHIRALDENLRCPICRDYFIAPVQLSGCSHTFCSRCIRESINSDSKCPVCRVEAFEGNLKRNGIMEEVIKCWELAAPAILLLQSTSNATTSAIPSIKHQLSDDETAPISKRIRVRSSSVKSVSDKSKEKGKAKQKVKYEPDEEGDSSDVEILDPVIKQKKLNRDPQDPNMAVKCPICNAKMPNSQLDRHINSNCGSNDTGSKSAWGNLMGSRQSEKKSSKGKAVVKQKSPPLDKRMANISYFNMGAKKIMEIIESAGLSTATPQPVSSPAALKYMTRRHGHFTILWNSNLDFADLEDAKRRTIPQLKKELYAWEILQDGIEVHDKKDVVKDLVEHEKLHWDQFRELTAQARASYNKARPVESLDSVNIEATVVDKNTSAVPPITGVVKDMDSPKDLIIKLIQSRESTPLPHLLDGHISSSSSQTASPVLVDQLQKLSPIQPRRERVSSPFDSNGPRPSQRERVLEEFEDDEGGESSFEAFGGLEMEEESQ